LRALQFAKRSPLTKFRSDISHQNEIYPVVIELICVFRRGGLWILLPQSVCDAVRMDGRRTYLEPLMFIASVICVLIAAAVPFALALLGLRRRP